MIPPAFAGIALDPDLIAPDEAADLRARQRREAGFDAAALPLAPLFRGRAVAAWGAEALTGFGRRRPPPSARTIRGST